MDADWRTQLQPEARSRVIDKIIETLRKHLRVPDSAPEALIELQRIAVRFEDKLYAAATSQSDYLRKISLKLLSMERQIKTEHNPQAIPASVDSGAGDFQEESYQMIQHVDNHMPAQKSSYMYERMKNFKALLERTLHFLQANKSSIQPGLREKIPIYERQIISILNSRRKPVQAPGSSSKGKNGKKLRCHFCKKGGHFKKDCPKKKKWFEMKGIAYDPTHKPT